MAILSSICHFYTKILLADEILDCNSQDIFRLYPQLCIDLLADEIIPASDD